MTVAFARCQWRSNTPLYYVCWLRAGAFAIKASGSTPLEAYRRAVDLLAAVR